MNVSSDSGFFGDFTRRGMMVNWTMCTLQKPMGDTAQEEKRVGNRETTDLSVKGK